MIQKHPGEKNGRKKKKGKVEGMAKELSREAARRLANTLDAESLDGSSVDNNRASRSGRVVTGENTVNSSAGNGSCFVMEASAPRLADS